MTESQDLLTEPPIAALDGPWSTRLAAAPGDRRARWLAAADALRGEGVEGHRRAQACYAALRADLDPADARGHDRVAWLLSSGAPRDAALAEVAERAATSDDADLRDAGGTVRAECRAVSGDLAGAERDLRALLARRGRDGSRAEAWARASLAFVMLSEGRELEALLSAARASRVVEGRPDASPRERCLVRQRLCSVLWTLDEPVERVEAAVEALAEAAASAPDAVAWPFRTYVLGARAELAVTRRDGAAAGKALEAMALSIPQGMPRPWAPGMFEGLVASVSLAAGRTRDAREQAEAALRLPGLGPREASELALIAARAHAATGDGAEARDLVRRRLVDLDDANKRREPGSALRARHALDLADLLRHELRAPDEAQLALLVAARAAAERVLEIDRCVRESPDLAEAHPADLETLAGYRARFVARHHVLGDDLARALVAGPGRSREMEALLPTGEWVLLCAWCLCVRTANERWIPAGHWIPRHEGLRLTHGICPGCFRRLRGRDSPGT
jgi:hypothetical protein